MGVEEVMKPQKLNLGYFRSFVPKSLGFVGFLFYAMIDQRGVATCSTQLTMVSKRNQPIGRLG